MSNTDSTTNHASSASGLPRQTTPTWEVELLISGVTVFAMLQLPAWLNQHLQMLLPRFGEDWNTPIIIGFVYITCAAIILSGTFILHLLLRAHWIARVGMHSVYPGGVHWEKLRLGPIQRAAERAVLGGAEAAIERADNRSSVVFAVGVMMASSLLTLALLIFALFVLIVLAMHWLGLAVQVDYLLLGVVVAMFLPLGASILLDRLVGARIRKGGLADRALGAVFRLYARLGLGNGSGMLGLLTSHQGRRHRFLISVLMALVCLATSLLMASSSGAARFLGGYELFPRFDQASAERLEAAHYDDQRAALLELSLPFVQSAVIEGSYLRLTVPYQPARDVPAQDRHCPQAGAIEEPRARAGALLACLASLHPVTLDGQPLAELQYFTGSDPRTERPTLVAMIDVRALAPGRHELLVAKPAPDAEDAESESFDRIVFWR